MCPVFAKGNERSVQLLLQLRKEAIKDQEPRVAQRFHAVALEHFHLLCSVSGM
jgi:hypothetical protein